MPKGLSKLILIVALLLGQASLLAHELDLEAHQAGDACEVCLLHSALDDTMASATTGIPVETNHVLDFLTDTPNLIQGTFKHYQSRAPPRHISV